jgi:hypothetical protein
MSSPSAFAALRLITSSYLVCACTGSFPQYAYARDSRRDLFEHLKPFTAQAVFELSKAGGIAARPRQTLDKASTNRIEALGEHYRHRSARL